MDLEDIYAERMTKQAGQVARQGARENQTRQELTYFLVSAIAIDTHVQKFLAAAAKAGFPGLDGLSKKEKRNRRVQARGSNWGRHYYESEREYPGGSDYYDMHLRIHIEGAWQWQKDWDRGWPSLNVSRHLALGRDGRGIYAGAGFDLSWNRHEIDPIGAEAGSEMIKAYADPNVAYQNPPEDVSENNDIEAETVRCLADLMLAQRIPID